MVLVIGMFRCVHLVFPRRYLFSALLPSNYQRNDAGKSKIKAKPQQTFQKLLKHLLSMELYQCQVCCICSNKGSSAENHVSPCRHAQRSKILVGIFLQKSIFWWKTLIPSASYRKYNKSKKLFSLTLKHIQAFPTQWKCKKMSEVKRLEMWWVFSFFF